MFELPKVLGNFEGEDVVIGIGRFGPYVKFGEQYVSIPKGEDPLSIEMERAQELIQEKQQADAPIAQYEGKPVTKGKGRFGPFIKWNDVFINVPRRYNFDALSMNDINELIETNSE